MSEQRVDVFCDGLLTNSVWSGLFTSAVGDEYVRRAMVLVPTHDLGVISQTREEMLTQRARGAIVNRTVGARDDPIGTMGF